MLNRTYYHSLLRKYVSVFGSLFDSIYIQRVDNTGTKKQTLKVPIKYGPKEKWVSLLARPLEQQQIAIQLPMIAFAIQSIEFDSGRQISPINQIINKKVGSISATNFVPVPYKISIDLYIIAKNQDDIAQIFEQIVPYFTPTLVNSVNLIPELSSNVDIPITLLGNSLVDDYEGDMMTRRTISWTLNFSLDVFFYGPTTTGKLIKKVITNLSTDFEKKEYIEERLTILPGLTVDGKPTTDKNDSVYYMTVNPNDDYGFVEEFETFTELKRESDD